MNREAVEQALLDKYHRLRKVNLKFFSKEQLVRLYEIGEITVTLDTIIEIFDERNQRADINTRLTRDNFGLRARLKSLAGNLTDWSKSEIINLYKTLFGRVTRAEDSVLKDIGAVSVETVQKDMSKAEQIVKEAQNIASASVRKYLGRS